MPLRASQNPIQNGPLCARRDHMATRDVKDPSNEENDEKRAEDDDKRQRRKPYDEIWCATSPPNSVCEDREGNILAGLPKHKANSEQGGHDTRWHLLLRHAWSVRISIITQHCVAFLWKSGNNCW